MTFVTGRAWGARHAGSLATADRPPGSGLPRHHRPGSAAAATRPISASSRSGWVRCRLWPSPGQHHGVRLDRAQPPGSNHVIMLTDGQLYRWPASVRTPCRHPQRTTGPSQTIRPSAPSGPKSGVGTRLAPRYSPVYPDGFRGGSYSYGCQVIYPVYRSVQWANRFDAPFPDEPVVFRPVRGRRWRSPARAVANALRGFLPLVAGAPARIAYRGTYSPSCCWPPSTPGDLRVVCGS